MVSTELQCVLPLTVSLSAKMANLAVWSSAAKAMSLLYSTHLPGKRVLRGVKISWTTLVVTSTISVIRLPVATANLQWATSFSCL
jgi:hypothetical protein